MFQGFLGVVNNRESYPLTSLKNIRIRPGHDNLVSLEAVDVVADQNIKDIDLEHRKCYFHDEYQLKMHTNYSQVRRHRTSGFFLSRYVRQLTCLTGKLHNGVSAGICLQAVGELRVHAVVHAGGERRAKDVRPMVSGLVQD